MRMYNPEDDQSLDHRFYSAICEKCGGVKCEVELGNDDLLEFGVKAIVDSTDCIKTLDDVIKTIDDVADANLDVYVEHVSHKEFYGVIKDVVERQARIIQLFIDDNREVEKEMNILEKNFEKLSNIVSRRLHGI